MLLTTAIEWAKHQRSIACPAAQALYARRGFVVLGRTPDRLRVDGHSLVDISMTLDVG
jgi:hypothetical protein